MLSCLREMSKKGENRNTERNDLTKFKSQQEIENRSRSTSSYFFLSALSNYALFSLSYLLCHAAPAQYQEKECVSLDQD